MKPIIIFLNIFQFHRDYTVNIEMKTTSLCNGDIENVRITLHNSQGVEPYDFIYDDISIRATSVFTETGKIKITVRFSTKLLFK